MTVLAGGWVDAAPFRAHLRFLSGVGSLTTEDVATLAGISTSAADHLLHGRAGRSVRRISPEVARRLLAITANDVRSMRWRLGPARRARLALAALRRAGRTDAEIAELAGISATDLAELAGSAEHCSQLLIIRLTTVARSNGIELVPPRSTALSEAA